MSKRTHSSAAMTDEAPRRRGKRSKVDIGLASPRALAHWCASRALEREGRQTMPAASVLCHATARRELLHGMGTASRALVRGDAPLSEVAALRLRRERARMAMTASYNAAKRALQLHRAAARDQRALGADAARECAAVGRAALEMAVERSPCTVTKKAEPQLVRYALRMVRVYHTVSCMVGTPLATSVVGRRLLNEGRRGDPKSVIAVTHAAASLECLMAMERATWRRGRKAVERATVRSAAQSTALHYSVPGTLNGPDRGTRRLAMTLANDLVSCDTVKRVQSTVPFAHYRLTRVFSALQECVRGMEYHGFTWGELELLLRVAERLAPSDPHHEYSCMCKMIGAAIGRTVRQGSAPVPESILQTLERLYTPVLPAATDAEPKKRGRRRPGAGDCPAFRMCMPASPWLVWRFIDTGRWQAALTGLALHRHYNVVGQDQGMEWNHAEGLVLLSREVIRRTLCDRGVDSVPQWRSILNVVMDSWWTPHVYVPDFPLERVEALPRDKHGELHRLLAALVRRDRLNPQPNVPRYIECVEYRLNGRRGRWSTAKARALVLPCARPLKLNGRQRALVARFAPPM